MVTFNQRSIAGILTPDEKLARDYIAAGLMLGIAMGVLQSDLVNFAGVAPMLIYRAKERDVLTISGLGKTYAVTGWRVGWTVAAATITSAFGSIPPSRAWPLPSAWMARNASACAARFLEP